MKKVLTKIFKIIGFVLVILVIVGAFMQVFGKGKVKPSEWFNPTTETTQPKDGVDGKDGTDGKDGETPYIGDNGNWFIGEVDTGVKAVGVDGKDGADGKDGETPYIGADGNWYIGETNTGVAATLIVEPVNENLISEDYETFFDNYYVDSSRFYINSPAKLNITADNGGDGRAYVYNHYGIRLYQNSKYAGLKMETDTEINFEIDKTMTLYFWLDIVPYVVDGVIDYPHNVCVRVDGVRWYASKVTDDERGYEFSLRLSAGEHTIRKGDSCVLSYLSLTA